MKYVMIHYSTEEGIFFKYKKESMVLIMNRRDVGKLRFDKYKFINTDRVSGKLMKKTYGIYVNLTIDDILCKGYIGRNSTEAFT